MLTAIRECQYIPCQVGYEPQYDRNWSALLDDNRQQETAHRYILGVYEVMDTITQRFQIFYLKVVLEAVEDLIPASFTLCLRPEQWWYRWGRALKDTIWNLHCLSCIFYDSPCFSGTQPSDRRITPIEFRHSVAMAGNFGYELDITKMDEEESSIKRASDYSPYEGCTVWWLYRLMSPFEGNHSSFLYVTEDKKGRIIFILCYECSNAPLYRILWMDWNHPIIIKLMMGILWLGRSANELRFEWTGWAKMGGF